jgi:hypothetical protein
MRKFWIAVLSIWCACAVGVSLISASGQSSQGPPVDETLNYINAAKPQKYKNDLDPPTFITMSKDRTALRILVEDNTDPNGFWTKEDEIVQILDLDPASVTVRHDGGVRDWISIQCLNKQNCDMVASSSSSGDHHFEHYNQFSFHIVPDADKADRVARALRHLVESLQAEYRQSHSTPNNPNDPFSKPQ